MNMKSKWSGALLFTALTAVNLWIWWGVLFSVPSLVVVLVVVAPLAGHAYWCGFKDGAVTRLVGTPTFNPAGSPKITDTTPPRKHADG